MYYSLKEATFFIIQLTDVLQNLWMSLMKREEDGERREEISDIKYTAIE